MKLTEGKKLVVCLGGCLLEDKPKEEDRFRVWEYEDWRERTLANRTKIVEGLTKVERFTMSQIFS